MTPDYQAAWELYYILADRRHEEGLVFDEVKRIVDAAWPSGKPMTWCEEHAYMSSFQSLHFCDMHHEGPNPCRMVEGVFIPIDEVEV